MARKQSDTSRFAYEKIMKGKDSHYKKIILALEWLVEGNNWEIAKQARMKPEQVWKRTGELAKPDENGVSCLIDTGKRNLNPDGNLAIVYGLYENRDKYTIPKENHYREGQTTAADYASELIAKTKAAQLQQKELFTEEKFFG